MTFPVPSPYRGYSPVDWDTRSLQLAIDALNLLKGTVDGNGTSISTINGQISTLQGQVAAAPKGRMGSSMYNTSVSGIGTTETLTDAVTFTAVTGRRYRVTWSGITFGTGGDQWWWRMRWKAGGTVDASGALFRSLMVGIDFTNSRRDGQLTGELSGQPSGTLTVGLLFVRSTGTGTMTRDGGAGNESLLIVDDVGA